MLDFVFLGRVPTIMINLGLSSFMDFPRPGGEACPKEDHDSSPRSTRQRKTSLRPPVTESSTSHMPDSVHNSTFIASNLHDTCVNADLGSVPIASCTFLITIDPTRYAQILAGSHAFGLDASTSPNTRALCDLADDIP
eukprot:g11368.t1